MRFRLSHFPDIFAAATEENLLEDSQCRQVQAFDVYHDSALFQSAKTDLATYRGDLPIESRNYKCYEGADDIKVSYVPIKYQFSKRSDPAIFRDSNCPIRPWAVSQL